MTWPEADMTGLFSCLFVSHKVVESWLLETKSPSKSQVKTTQGSKYKVQRALTNPTNHCCR
jgi:hypothetical protein